VHKIPKKERKKERFLKKETGKTKDKRQRTTADLLPANRPTGS
jgi:hypothetical protein